jgi:hypothetical protein
MIIHLSPIRYRPWLAEHSRHKAVLCQPLLIFQQEPDSSKDENTRRFRPRQGHSGANP